MDETYYKELVNLSHHFYGRICVCTTWYIFWYKEFFIQIWFGSVFNFIFGWKFDKSIWDTLYILKLTRIALAILWQKFLCNIWPRLLRTCIVIEKSISGKNYFVVEGQLFYLYILFMKYWTKLEMVFFTKGQ